MYGLYFLEPDLSTSLGRLDLFLFIPTYISFFFLVSEC